MVKQRILIIDDEEANCYLMSKALKKNGYEVIEANSGNEGLILAKENPSLIILDVKLPDIHGMEIAKILKSDPQTIDIPILQTSASFTLDTDYVEGINSGADSYLIQPINPHVLVSTVRALLRLRSAERDARLKKQSEYELEKFFCLSTDLLCICDKDMNLIKASASKKDFLGYPDDMYANLSLAHLVHPKQIDSFYSAVRILQKGEEAELDLDLLCYDGTYKESKCRFLKDKKRDELYFVAKDLGFYPELKSSLQKLEAESDLFLRKAPTPFAVINSAGKYLKVNEAFAHMLGYNSSEMTAPGFPDLTCAKDFKYNKEAIQNLTRGFVKEVNLEKHYIRKDGSLIRVKEFLSVLEKDPLRIGIISER